MKEKFELRDYLVGILLSVEASCQKEKYFVKACLGVC